MQRYHDSSGQGVSECSPDKDTLGLWLTGTYLILGGVASGSHDLRTMYSRFFTT